MTLRPPLRYPLVKEASEKEGKEGVFLHVEMVIGRGRKGRKGKEGEGKGGVRVRCGWTAVLR